MEKRFETFTTLILKISRYIRKIKSEEMKDYNLQGAHVSCLYYLYKSDKPLTAKELCDLCEEDKAVISRSIEVLERDNYIVCDSTKEKRYKSQLTLTPKGIEVGKNISKKIDVFTDLGGDGMTEEKRRTLYECLTAICENLQKECDKYGD